MEDLLIYAADLMAELDELQDECNAMIEQRVAMLNVWGDEEIDKMEVATRLQSLDALLSVNYKLMSDSYAELKRLEREIAYGLMDPPEEENMDEDGDGYC